MMHEIQLESKLKGRVAPHGQLERVEVELDFTIADEVGCFLVTPIAEVGGDEIVPGAAVNLCRSVEDMKPGQLKPEGCSCLLQGHGREVRHDCWRVGAALIAKRLPHEWEAYLGDG